MNNVTDAETIQVDGITIRRTADGHCYWSIENSDGHRWKSITPELYRALKRHEKERRHDHRDVP